ncbi:MAG: phosphatidylglycerophosphatase A [Deltaproteobacteria bacterium]|nr:MAG: phosphatidylglycerophosphatase A [Deltaproteobacteria bacterium]
MVEVRKDDWIAFLASGCGLGTLPKVPGTWGSLGALPLWFLLGWLSNGWYLLLVILFSGAAIWVADEAGKIFKVVDSPVIVIDEIAGLMLGLLGVSLSFTNALAAFLLFRFFDIVKPFPADWCEANLPGGYGVVIDDLVAGIMTWIVMQIFFV